MDATIYFPTSRSAINTVTPHHLQDDCDLCIDVKWITIDKNSFTSWSDKSSTCLRFLKSPPKIPSCMKDSKRKDLFDISRGLVTGHKQCYVEKREEPYKRTQWFLSKVCFDETHQKKELREEFHRLRFIVSLFTKEKKCLRKIWKQIVKKIAQGSFPSCNTCFKPEENIIILYTYSKQQHDVEKFLKLILPDDSAVFMEVL